MHVDFLIFHYLSLDALLLGGPHATVCSLTCTAHLCSQDPLANLLREELGAENHSLSTYFFILTHFNTEKEARSKKRFDKKELDNVKLITVIKGVNKCEVVDCENAVLVDDYMGNLVLWQANGGIPIKFSDKGKKYDIMSISNLTELIDRYDEICSLVETNNKKLVNSKK